MSGFPKAKNNGEAREPIPPGTYLATLIGIFDLGTQPSPQFGPQHQILFVFELAKKNKSGLPMQISRFYTLSFGEKSNLRKDVVSWLGGVVNGDEFDVTTLIGKACQLSIASYKKQNGKDGDKIAAIMGLPDGMPAPASESDEVIYALDATRPIPDDVPSWIAEKIQESEEWVKAHGERQKKDGEPQQATTRPTVSRPAPLPEPGQCPDAIKPLLAAYKLEWPLYPLDLDRARGDGMPESVAAILVPHVVDIPF